MYFSGEHTTCEDTVAEDEGATDDPSHRNSAALAIHFHSFKIVVFLRDPNKQKLSYLKGYEGNYDEYLESVPCGTHYPANQKGVPDCKRRSNDRLGCTRVPFIEPIGASRERFYEQKLALGTS